MAANLTTEEIRERVAAVPGWYHTFEFPGGIVTDGIYDHRRVLGRLPWQQSLAGKRCLDLAACNGLFSFEMARRGGDVVSLDVDDSSKWDWQGPPPESDPSRVDGKGLATQGFEVARDIYGLDVDRVEMSLYDVSPERLGGTFDFVFIGNVLLHLSDPARALRAARSVTAGQLLSFETISLALTLTRPRTPCASLYEIDQARWWTPNVKAHRRLLSSTGFEIDSSGFLLQPFGKLSRGSLGVAPWRSPQRYGPQLGYWLFHRPFGVPSQWLMCR